MTMNALSLQCVHVQITLTDDHYHPRGHSRQSVIQSDLHSVHVEHECVYFLLSNKVYQDLFYKGKLQSIQESESE